MLISRGVRDWIFNWLDSGMASTLRFSMKQGIHPEYKDCSNVLKNLSTLGKDINLDMCCNVIRFIQVNNVLLTQMVVLNALTTISKFQV
ncbi:50S ribosomal protein L31 domain protein [Aggregatibacter sp. oral taxon 458 str. W10330]|nr:50S ribosomal protein L31 domain protein [Aggregatibacter sp. oral taxon 458 str. W10330]